MEEPGDPPRTGAGLQANVSQMRPALGKHPIQREKQSRVQITRARGSECPVLCGGPQQGWRVREQRLLREGSAVFSGKARTCRLHTN